MINISTIVTFTQWHTLHLKNIIWGHTLVNSAETFQVLNTLPPPASLPSTPRFTTVQIEVIPIPNMDRGHPNFSLISPSSPPYGFAIFFDLSAKFCYIFGLTVCPIIRSISHWCCKAFIEIRIPTHSWRYSVFNFKSVPSNQQNLIEHHNKIFYLANYLTGLLMFYQFKNFHI